MATVAIIGGGISGLTCAHYLKTLGRSKIKYLFLLEKSPKFGGWIQTTRFPDNAVFDHGPRTLRVGSKSGYNTLALADELGLASRIIPIDRTHKTARINYILSKNELHPLPRDFISVLKTRQPFSKPLVYYLFKELIAKRLNLEDESVYSFVNRRFGNEIAEYIIDPLCRGISAGNARELSVKSMFPVLYEAESKYGSVVKGLLKDRENSASDFMHIDLVRNAHMKFWKMWTFKTGMSELVDALACSIEQRGVCDLLFNAECSSLTFKGNKAVVQVENENIEVDHIFSSIPSHQLSNLVHNYQSLAEALMTIPSVDVAVVYLEYEKNVLNKNGFGFLSPSTEDSKVMGIVFDSCCFPEMNGKSKTRLTCMLGGRWFSDIFGNAETVSQGEILQTAISETAKHLKIVEKPVRHKVVVQRKCIPQYIVGHHKVLVKIEEEIQRNNLCLSLLGASYKGAGVPDCIYNAKLSVEKFLKTI